MDARQSINLNQNELQNAVIQPLSLAPTSTPKSGQLYFLIGTGMQEYNGSIWTTIETQANKGKASGYASLDASTKVPVAQLPTGTSSNTIPLLKGTIPDGYGLVYSASALGFISKSFAGVFVYKGSVATYADLPASGNTTGDTWNVVAAYGDFPPGTNWAWNGTTWDALGGSVDLSAYLTIANAAATYQTLANLTTTIASTSTDAQYPSAKSVYTVTQALNSSITSEASTRASADTTLQNNINGKVSIAQGTANASKFVKTDSAGAINTFALLSASDIPSLSATYVDLSSAQTVAGVKTFSSTIVGSVNGNAGTATILANARNLSLSDADATNTGTAVSFNGSASVVLPLPSTIKAALTGNASTATALQTARSINVSDADATNTGTGASFDGTAGIVIKLPSTIKASLTGTATTATKLSNTSAVGGVTVPVYFTASGVPAVCTSISLNAATATALATARTIQVALGSTSSASFNGTANITPGVSGTLAVANGGTGNTSVDTSPVSGSTKMVTSGGLFTAFSNKTGRYVTTITGDGTTTSWTLTHSLGQKYVACEVYDSSDNSVICGKTATSTTQITISISPAPTSSETFTVVVIG